MGWSLPFWLLHQHHSNNEKFATVNAKLKMETLHGLQLQFCKVLSFWMMNVKPTCATIAVIKNWLVWGKYGNRKVVSLFHSFDSQILTLLSCKNSLFTVLWASTYYLFHLTYFTVVDPFWDNDLPIWVEICDLTWRQVLTLFLGKKINRESSQSSVEPMTSQTSSQTDENLPRESSRDSIESIDSVEKEEDAPKRMVPLSKREIKDENEIKARFSFYLLINIADISTTWVIINKHGFNR